MDNSIHEFDRFAARIAELRSCGLGVERLLAEVEEPFRDLLRQELLPPALRAEHQTGARHLLHRSDAVTIFAMASAPGSISEVHDHGTWGLVGQVVGEEVEQLYASERTTEEGVVLKRLSSRHLKPGEITTVLPPGRDIHQVVNVGTGPSVSLHAFAHDLVHHGFTVFTPAFYAAVTYTGQWDNEAATSGHPPGR